MKRKTSTPTKKGDVTMLVLQGSTLLSPREMETLKSTAEGLTSKEIGETLFISEETVETHRRNIMRKLGAKNMVAAVTLAFRRKILK